MAGCIIPMPSRRPRAPLKVRDFEQPHQPNLTGTEGAYKPGGSLSRGGLRPPATGDYQAWKPD